MQPAPSDAILTVPNLLTSFRLGLIPLFVWLAVGPDHIGGALAVAGVGFATDVIDGRVARRYGQVSKLGIALDPLSDRLSLAAGAAVILVHDLAPLWAVLVVVARDALLVLAGAPVLRALRVPIPPVSVLGKKVSFGISLCFALFLGSGISSLQHPSRAVQDAAWVTFWVSAPLYYVTAAGYAREALRELRRRRFGPAG